MANNITSTSIVDFLKGRGFKPAGGEKFPLFDVRKGIFEQAGLTQQLGEFRGSAKQNTALLNRLAQGEKDIGVGLNPENVMDIIGVTQTPEPTPPTRFNIQDILPQTLPEEQTATEVQQAVDTQIGSQVAAVPTDISAVLPPIPQAGDVAQQALTQVQRGITFPLRQEAATAQKAAIQLAGQRQVQQTIKSFASRGLFFSGARKAEVTAVEADTLARQLGIDRDFALLIAQGLQTAAQDIVKEAQKGREEAIDSLEALGFAINPVTGGIEPTLAARREEQRAAEAARTAARLEGAEEIDRQIAIAKFELDDAKFEFDQAKTSEQLRQSQEKIAISEANLAIAQQREIRLATEDGSKLAASAGFFDAKIEGSVREDFVELSQGWVNSNVPTELEAISAFATLRKLYSPQEASDAALKELAGVQEVTLTPTQEEIADSFMEDTTSSLLDFISPESVFGFFEDPLGTRRRKEERRQQLIDERNQAIKAGDQKRIREIDEELFNL